MTQLTGKLIIVRHGESEWNATGQWTGLTDVHITAKGRHDAGLMGEKLHDMHFDHAFTSEQIRTVETLQELLKAQGQTDLLYDRRWAINERDYGQYTGLNKWEVKEKVGEEVFNGIRRGWDYPIPGGESLKDVYARSIPFYQSEVLERLRKDQNVLLSGHGNSIRSLMKFIENISDDDIGSTEFVFGTIAIYTIDDTGRMAHKEQRIIDAELPPA
ncbi:MAG TPA: 2,3-bisphosphoglycerate-dependent phosphoglycerate mutase [Candidatus Saccharimonas sp.]|nr:2,3-bisphosphoglycerate-dependent phosphoglycerate mutase [Candidatus Saccharimonas sp.]